MESKKGSVSLAKLPTRIIKLSQHRMKKRRTSGGIIHTTIRSLKEKQRHDPLSNLVPLSNYRQQQAMSYQKNKVDIDNSKDKQQLERNNTSTITTSSKIQLQSVSHISKNQRQSPYSFENTLLNTKEAWSDGKGMTIDHHQTKKKKKPHFLRKCIIALSILILIVGIVITVVLITITTKSKTTTSTEPVLRWNTTGITIVGITNVSGNTSNLLYTPFGITLDYPKAFYIVDRGNHRVQKFLTGSFNGSTIAGQANGTWSTTASYLREPSNVVFDSNENAYISDTSNHRVQLWMKNAVTGTMIAGGIGSGNSQLVNPYGLARDPNTDALYIVDSGNHRVMCYAKNATSGTVVAGGNGNGTNTSQLLYPRGLYFDSLSNSLVIINYNVPNVVRWTLGASNWILLANNVNVSATSTMASPSDVTFDPMGNMYIADRGNHRIIMFRIGETNAITIAGIKGISGINATLLNNPYSLKLDSQLNLYVTDTNNYRVQKFLRY